jgi:hypothetical protein
VGKQQRVIDVRERALCSLIVDRIAAVLRHDRPATADSLNAIKNLFDEQVVSAYLRANHGFEIELGTVFGSLRQLSEQSYENKSLAFGCLIDPGRDGVSNGVPLFPDQIQEWKRYRALTDGYRTAFRISRNGAIIGFHDLASLRQKKDKGSHFYPEWCEDIAAASRKGVLGVSLTRQGDVLVFDSGTLRFTYRFGQWQYWNHSHIIDLLKSRARVQRVPPKRIGSVVSTLYRAALDVSFRRAGGLFVLLRNQKKVNELVLRGDAIGDPHRDPVHAVFDSVLESKKIQDLPRTVLVELASLDGAVVLNNNGQILAYAAVLQPKRRGKVGPAEGSRTKAAIGASKYGLAIKVSSDGDITFYEDGKKYLDI